MGRPAEAQPPPPIEGSLRDPQLLDDLMVELGVAGVIEDSGDLTGIGYHLVPAIKEA